MKFDRGTRTRIEKAAREWWTALQPMQTKNGSTLPGNRAALAKLRRATNPLGAAAEPATFDLFRKLEFQSSDAEAQLSRVAVLASVLAHVREDVLEKVGRALGPPSGAKNGDGAVMTSLRLARLLAARGDEEIATVFRRAIAMLDQKANVGDLAWLILTWDRDEIGDRTRTLFAFAYHDASAYAPTDDTSASTAILPPNA